jgi:hypothetical protein
MIFPGSNIICSITISDLFTDSPPYLQIQRALTPEISNFQRFPQFIGVNEEIYISEDFQLLL